MSPNLVQKKSQVHNKFTRLPNDSKMTPTTSPKQVLFFRVAKSQSALQIANYNFWITLCFSTICSRSKRYHPFVKLSTVSTKCAHLIQKNGVTTSHWRQARGARPWNNYSILRESSSMIFSRERSSTRFMNRTGAGPTNSSIDRCLSPGEARSVTTKGDKHGSRDGYWSGGFAPNRCAPKERRA